MMAAEYYRGGEKSSNRYNDHGSTDRSTDSETRAGYSYYKGSKQNGHAGQYKDKTEYHISRDTIQGHESTSSATIDSTGKQKSFRRLFTRFADKTSMVGVPYINNAKFWWARLIWSIMLLVAMGVMVLHLWYLISQYYEWPVQTKISLGYKSLIFPEVTLCNTNVMHMGRFEKFTRAEDLKELVEALKPTNIAPDQYDPDYNPYATKQPQVNQHSHGAGQNQGNNQQQQPNTNADGMIQHDGVTQPSGVTQPYVTPSNTPSKRRKRFVDNYDNFNTSKYNSGTTNPRNMKPPEKGDYSADVDKQTEIDDLFTELYMDIDRTSRSRLGHNISDMLLSCTFNGRECTSDMFKLHQTADYGNCWSIKSNKFRVKNSGLKGGLTLILYLEVTEYLKGVTNGYGARVQVHERLTYPFPADEGHYVPASMETDIALRMVAIERLGGSYGNCDDGTAFFNTYGHKYTRRTCQSFCKSMKIMDTCNCFGDAAEELSDLKKETLKPCRSEPEVECMVDIQRQYGNNKLSCTCENPCSEVVYSKTASQRQWPSDDYAMVLLQGLCDRDKDVCASLRGQMSDTSKISNNFLKLNIYYEDLNYENITEHPEIEFHQFLSDVGGAFGLWIGLSILSLCELVQLFVELCDYGVHKTMKNSRRERNTLKRQKEKQNGTI